MRARLVCKGGFLVEPLVPGDRSEVAVGELVRTDRPARQARQGPALRGWELVSATSAGNSSDKSILVGCSPARACRAEAGSGATLMSVSSPATPVDDDTWTVSAGEDAKSIDQGWTVTAWAICATV